MLGHQAGNQRFNAGLFLVALIFSTSLCGSLSAGILPLGPEQDVWSDMAFPANVTGGFTSGTMDFTASAFPSNDLEIGLEFGPSNAGKHYGTSGTLGGAFSATLNVTGVEIQPDGTVTNGGSFLITYNGGAPGSIGDDYGIVAGAALLTGSVSEVLLDATGDDTLDVLFSITGGALQTPNPTLGVVFAPNYLGLLRIAGVTMPSDFSSSFSLNGATINVFGLPEPSSIVLGLLGAMLVFVSRSRRSLRD